MKNNVLDFGYLMLLGWPWLCIALVTHDWGNNLITIEGNGIVLTIIMTKHLDSNTKHPKVLLCYDMTKKITYEEKEMFFTINWICLQLGPLHYWNRKFLMPQFLVKKLEPRILYSIFHILRDKSEWILPQHASKFKIWILDVTWGSSSMTLQFGN
jgi:hypothetical protein